MSSSPIPLTQHIPTLLFLSITVLTSSLVSRAQPTPYIDEIFHIPQAQRFCAALSAPLSSFTHSLAKLRDVQYDGKLTTPPGLYAISVGLAKVLPGWRCDDVAWLRGTNLVLLLTLPVLIARTLRQNEERSSQALSTISPNKSFKMPAKAKPIPRSEIARLQQKAKLEAPPTPDGSQDNLPDIAPPTISALIDDTSLIDPVGAASSLLLQAPKRKEPTPYIMAVASSIAFLPPLWFFGFLYYTDLASIWLVLACFTLYNDLDSPSSPSSVLTKALIMLSSILAVLVRQTNIVWVAFCAGQGVLSQLSLGSTADAGLIWEVVQVFGAALGRDRSRFWKVVVRNAAPLIPMLVGCGWFIRWNGSIVLGDKSNHQAGLHLPQIGYFIAFACFFGFFPLLSALSTHSPSFKGKRKTFISTLTKSMISCFKSILNSMLASPTSLIITATTLVTFYLAVDRYTIDHPFLLADNRHYTFYAWRPFRSSYKLPGVSVKIELRYAMVPAYTVGLFAWTKALSRRGALFGVLFWLATAATLVPTPLVEVRYYLLPFIILRIYSQPQGVIQEEVKAGKDGKTAEIRKEGRDERWTFLLLELALYAAINGITLALFIGKSFEWPRDAVDQSRGEGVTMRFIW
ncbi:related to Alpha-1,2 glucosyltransferase ALG10 [Ustilago trichophora]|uniref:Dol-P-Glc:Glc(2)Man(9)GlcNAc(2)-PP-Dol alpha-1,2-glucosyltransferase n=1 Tax=Ustilago trichophora TaxID=86804 RepID=A0A5C3EI20_9BASI|nr:related to Alpha-1,2 glucosyltransferase ALG10 [Ustilago trichophora]